MKKTILHIESGRHLYGGAKQVTYLLDALSDSRYKNILACPIDSDISRVPMQNCIIEPITMHGDLDILLIRRLSKLIEKYKVDLVHVHSRRGADLWGGIAAKINGIAAICTRRVDNTESQLAKIKYQNYQAVVSISEGVRSVIQPLLSSQQHQPIIHSAVDFSPFKITNTKDKLAEQYGFPAHHYVVANFAQLISRKGQLDIISAMAEVVKLNPCVTCLLFGRGKQYSRYKTLIRQLNLEKNVILCGFTDNVPEVLASVDAVVHPAYKEGLGVILLQASAAKKAIIASDAGGIPEVVKHEDTGIVVKAGDVGGLAMSIINLQHAPEKSKRLGLNAYQRAQRLFSISTMADSYDRLYSAVLQQSA